MKRIMIIALVATAFAAVGVVGAGGRAAPPLVGQVVGKGELIARVKVAASEFKFVLSAKSARRGSGDLQGDERRRGSSTTSRSKDGRPGCSLTGSRRRCESRSSARETYPYLVHGARPRRCGHERCFRHQVGASLQPRVLHCTVR